MSLKLTQLGSVKEYVINNLKIEPKLHKKN